MSNNEDNGNAAAMREALERAKRIISGIATLSSDQESRKGAKWLLDEWVAPALSAPPRNCDIYTDFNNAITTLANKRNWHDGKWDSERYCILANWLLANAT